MFWSSSSKCSLARRVAREALRHKGSFVILEEVPIGVCDVCGSTRFKRRPDDNAETMKTRLLAYYKETSPLIGYYFCKGSLKSVDGMEPIDKVASEIERVLAALA